VPFTPAGLGLADGAMVFVLTAVYHVPQTEAVAITLVDRAISVLSVIVVGGIAYVFSSKTRGDPAMTGGDGTGGTAAARTPVPVAAAADEGR
jgi:uncharacterized protein (TIRG00374 family)